jgi:replicative DNA helicase
MTRPVGSQPDTATAFVGALLYAPAPVVTALAELVTADDFDDVAGPAAVVWSACCDVARRDLTPDPVLVAGELRREGQYDRRVATWLNNAVTAGASPESARSYAVVLVAESLRRQCESFGTALTTSAATCAEADLTHLAATAAERVRTTADRLATLRGEAA